MLDRINSLVSNYITRVSVSISIRYSMIQASIGSQCLEVQNLQLTSCMPAPKQGKPSRGSSERTEQAQPRFQPQRVEECTKTRTMHSIRGLLLPSCPVLSTTGPSYIASCNIREWVFGLYESFGTESTRKIGDSPTTVVPKVERWGLRISNLIRRESLPRS